MAESYGCAPTHLSEVTCEPRDTTETLVYSLPEDVPARTAATFTCFFDVDGTWSFDEERSGLRASFTSAPSTS